jgi:aerobic carbon-monoxide dehydrogenase medium subunit
VKPAPFAYCKVYSLKEAITLLSEHQDARVLAGGQSLIATLNMRLSAPSLLIDINAIKGLDRIDYKNGMVEIGALVRHAQAEHSDIIDKYAPLIARALPHIGHPAIRTRGTLCGSVAFADPAAELPACLLALDAELGIVGPGGQRTMNAKDFFKGLFETALERQDILTTIRLRAAGPDTRTGFVELARRHGDYAMIGLAASARADGKGLSDVRLAYFGAGNTPVRAMKAEAVLSGGTIDEKRLEAAISALDLEPHDEVQATASVKKHLAGVLLKRVAKQLIGSVT